MSPDNIVLPGSPGPGVLPRDRVTRTPLPLFATERSRMFSAGPGVLPRDRVARPPAVGFAGHESSSLAGLAANHNAVTDGLA